MPTPPNLSEKLENVLFLRTQWAESRSAMDRMLRFRTYSQAYEALTVEERAQLAPVRQHADRFTAQKKAANRRNTLNANLRPCCGHCGSKTHRVESCPNSPL
jgi:hypothetical protein